MDFEFTPDQLELRDNARSVLAAECPASLVRAVFEGEGDGDKLWRTLVDLGWPAIGIAEASGGLGLTFVEVGLVVEELGRVVAPSPFLSTVTQFAPLVRGTSFETQVAEGAITGAAAFGDGFVLDAATADEIAVVEGNRVYVVPTSAATITPARTLDPTMPLADVTFDKSALDSSRVLDGVDVERARDEAVAAMALSTVATCRAIFEQTLDYAKLREQFGKPIGSFQAVKHRLADMYLAVEKASALASFAALTIAEDDERRTIAASMAKSSAGDCQRLVARDGLQLHGGIGFTWENDLHFWLKRAKTGDALLGNGVFHRTRVAQLMGLAS